MLPINDLGSDSPLYFSLLGHPCEHAWKHINRTVVTSALRFRGQSRCPETNHRPCASVEPRICTGFRTNFCSSARAPSTSESRCGLTHVRALVREFRRNIDEQLAHLVEHWCASPRGNAGLDSRELAASLLSPKSAACVVVAVHIGTSLADNHSSLSGVSNAELDAKSALRVWHFLACLFVDSRASQINSSQIN